jgi:Kef-type K+ transport system membrane component KefB
MDLDLTHFELPFFTNLLILLVTARLLGEVFERFKQPSMIGEIIAGILLGPSLFNIIHHSESIRVISDLGVFLLVILAGLEIDIENIIKSFKGKNLIILILGFVIPLGSGILVGHFFGLQIMTTMFIGLCIAITALPVSIRILMDLGKLNTKIGQTIISNAIFDDILALSVLGVLLNLKDTDLSFNSILVMSSISLLKLLLFITILTLSYFLIQKITNKGNYIEVSLNKLLHFMKGKEPLFVVFFAFILLFAMVTEMLGFHFVIGAFFASMLLSESIIGKQHLKSVEHTTSSLANGFLAPIFFAAIGLEFNFFSIQNWWLLLAVVLVSYFSKIIGGYTGSRFAGLNHKTSSVIGIGLNARGIMELVIANIAYKANLISSEIFSILVIMGVLTTLTTPIMLKWGFNRIDKAKVKKLRVNTKKTFINTL